MPSQKRLPKCNTTSAVLPVGKWFKIRQLVPLQANTHRSDCPTPPTKGSCEKNIQTTLLNTNLSVSCIR